MTHTHDSHTGAMLLHTKLVPHKHVSHGVVRKSQRFVAQLFSRRNGNGDNGCSVVQCGALWCIVVQCVAVWLKEPTHECCCGRIVEGLGAVLCSVLHCCSVLQYIVVCCSVLQRAAVCCVVLHGVAGCCSALQRAAVGGHFLQYVGVLPCVAVCCSVLQCVAVCCSVLQCHSSILRLGGAVMSLENESCHT